MRWIFSLLLTMSLLLTQKFAASEHIILKEKVNGAELVCDGGSWIHNNSTSFFIGFEDHIDEYTCSTTKKNRVFVKIMTCKNCVEFDPTSVVAILSGNILGTVIIGVAVYSLSTQSRPKGFSGNKASDKVQFFNGESDTYQSLTGQSSEYSQLEGRRK